MMADIPEPIDCPDCGDRLETVPIKCPSCDCPLWAGLLAGALHPELLADFKEKSE